MHNTYNHKGFASAYIKRLQVSTTDSPKEKWANSTLQKEDIQRVNKYENMLNRICHTQEWLKLKRPTIPNVVKDVK